MSFVTFLKKAGQVLSTIAMAEAGIAPVLEKTIPSATNVIDKMDLIFKSVVATEGQFAAAYPGQQTGPQKLLAASSLVGPILSTVDTIRGKQIANEAAYTAAVQGIVTNVANLLNSLKPTNDTATTAASVPAPAVAVTPPAVTK